MLLHLYQKTCFQNLRTLRENLQIYAINHQLEDFDLMWQNTQVSDIRPIGASSLLPASPPPPPTHTHIPPPPLLTAITTATLIQGQRDL